MRTIQFAIAVHAEADGDQALQPLIVRAIDEVQNGHLYVGKSTLLVGEAGAHAKATISDFKQVTSSLISRKCRRSCAHDRLLARRLHHDAHQALRRNPNRHRHDAVWGAVVSTLRSVLCGLEFAYAGIGFLMLPMDAKQALALFAAAAYARYARTQKP